MKCLTLITITFLFSSFATGQSQLYEKGYVMDLQGRRADGYIMVEDWNAQHGIRFRSNMKDAPILTGISRVKEFGIGDKLKYISTKTNIDISGDEESLLSHEKNPEWDEEELFLRTLVEGKINLYAFEGNNISRYFFNEESSPVEQLVFKKYRTSTGVQINATYQSTLYSRFNCMDSTQKYFETIKYRATDLTRLFVEINSCEGAASTIYELPGETLETTGQNKAGMGSVSTAAEEKPAGLTDHYLGIVANQLIRQLFNFGGGNNAFNAPYLIQYAINSKKNGKGFNVGLNYDKGSFTDNSNGTTRKTANSNFAIRMGYDQKYQWGKRWVGIFGLDLLIDKSKSKTESPQPGTPTFTLETTSKGWGFGPRFGLLFRISDKVLLGTDASYYVKSSKSTQLMPSTPSSNQTAKSFSLALPVALFLTVKLK